jgi:hypothetical protein
MHSTVDTTMMNDDLAHEVQKGEISCSIQNSRQQELTVLSSASSLLLPHVRFPESDGVGLLKQRSSSTTNPKSQGSTDTLENNALDSSAAPIPRPPVPGAFGPLRRSPCLPLRFQ